MWALWDSGNPEGISKAVGRLFHRRAKPYYWYRYFENYCTYYCPAVEPLSGNELQILSGAETRNNGGGDT